MIWSPEIVIHKVKDTWIAFVLKKESLSRGRKGSAIRSLSHLGHLRQATDVRVLVEKDLVGHFLPDLSLGPLLLSSRTQPKNREKKHAEHARNKEKSTPGQRRVGVKQCAHPISFCWAMASFRLLYAFYRRQFARITYDLI